MACCWSRRGFGKTRGNGSAGWRRLWQFSPAAEPHESWIVAWSLVPIRPKDVITIGGDGGAERSVAQGFAADRPYAGVGHAYHEIPVVQSAQFGQRAGRRVGQVFRFRPGH